MPHSRRRRPAALLAALTLLLLLAACSSDTPEETKTAPTTGAQKRSALEEQWRYQSVRTPKKRRVRVVSTNAWLRLGADGHVQGQDGRPWRGSYRTGRGWVTFDAEDRASLAPPKHRTRAERLVSRVTTKLLAGDRVRLRRPGRGTLRLSVDGYVLTLRTWR